MINSDDLFKQSGFTLIPDELKSKTFHQENICSQFNDIDFNQAINFYGLHKHKEFMSLFSDFQKKLNHSSNLKTAVIVLNRYLFSSERYGWEHYLKRDQADMLPAFILLSGYERHRSNMILKGFDQNQIEIHRKRIYECCTIGLDTYKTKGVGISQLIWGSIFINAHIVEEGRLQFELAKYEYNFENFHPEDKFCINIHIPRGGPLFGHMVEKALQRSTKLIGQYFHEIKTRPAYIMDSWLLTEGLDEFLPDESNIKNFRRYFDILGYTKTSSIAKFLFNTVSSDIQSYPEDTKLRFSIKKALLEGRQFVDGVGILKS